jgi:aspartate-semialdehyde dehydrogenase
MTELTKSRNQSWSGMYRVAIVGASSLRGRELKDTLEERNFPVRDIVLLDDDQALGQLEAVGDEATFIQGVARNSFENVDVVFFAGEPAFTRQHWRAAEAQGCALVDLSSALEEDAKLPVRSPWLDKELQGDVQNVDLKTTAVAVASPAATILALLLYRVQRTGAVQSTVVNLFEPVSEQGKKGMDELHQQTLNLLGFQPLPKQVFDIQVAFNLVSRFGEEAKASIEEAEALILRHIRAIGRAHVELPALQLLQAPIFHGHTASLYLELDKKIAPNDFALALHGEHVTIVGLDEDPPSNVSAAGQENILVSVRADANRPNGIWLWSAADNLKISALTAVECAAHLVATRPSGKIQ